MHVATACLPPYDFKVISDNANYKKQSNISIYIWYIYIKYNINNQFIFVYTKSDTTEET